MSVRSIRAWAVDCESSECIACDDLHENAHSQCLIRPICIQYSEEEAT